MERSIFILGVLGFAAVGLRGLRAAIGLAGQGADAFLAREMAETRARRGDLTGMAEAEAWRLRARRERTRAATEMAICVVLLALPPIMLSSPIGPYAVYSIFWLLNARLRKPMRSDVA